MNKILNYISLITITGIVCACNGCNEKGRAIKIFDKYYASVKIRSEDKWHYTTDTVKLWFDDKTGQPIIRIRNKGLTGIWMEWDVEMNSTTSYDSIWFDKQENAIKGYFYEDNDFYHLIGKSPTKTLRTYWFNKNKKIKEILIYWIPELNTTTSDHLQPIVDWALIYDSLEVAQLYPNGKLIPSKDNAMRWKKLLKKI